MRILVMKNRNHPKFQYGLFLSSKDKQFSSDQNSIEEACGCELVMARYIYAMAFNLSAYPIVQRIKKGILSNFDMNIPANLT